MRKRKVWVAPRFAEAKDWHGLRRFRLRGLPKVNGEALLIAASHNLKRLLSRCRWGRRPWPNGAAGVVHRRRNRSSTHREERALLLSREPAPLRAFTPPSFFNGLDRAD